MAKIFPRERQPRFFILELQSLDLDAIRRAIRDATVPNLSVAHPEPVPPPPRRLRRGDAQRRVRPTGIVVRRDEPSEQRAAIDEALGVDAPRALPGARARPLGGGGHRHARGRVVSESAPPGDDSRGSRGGRRVVAADTLPRELKAHPRSLPRRRRRRRRRSKRIPRAAPVAFSDRREPLRDRGAPHRADPRRFTQFIQRGANVGCGKYRRDGLFGPERFPRGGCGLERPEPPIATVAVGTLRDDAFPPSRREREEIRDRRARVRRRAGAIPTPARLVRFLV